MAERRKFKRRDSAYISYQGRAKIYNPIAARNFPALLRHGAVMQEV
jgi:hypothetical protein